MTSATSLSKPSANTHRKGDAVTVHGLYNDAARSPNQTEQVVYFRRCIVISWGKQQAALRDADSGETCKFRVSLDNGTHTLITAGHEPDGAVVKYLLARKLAECERTATVHGLECVRAGAAHAAELIRTGATRVADRVVLSAETAARVADRHHSN